METQNIELFQRKLGFPNWTTLSCVSDWLFCRENIFAAASSVTELLGQGQIFPASTVKTLTIYT